MAGAVSEKDKAAARSVLAVLSEAWRRADGAAFATAFTEDADFVNIRGMSFQGPDAIAAQHQQIFDTVYRGSQVQLELVSLRRLADDVLVALVASNLEVPSGPRAGTTKTTATAVLVGDAAALKIAAFQNTVFAPPGA
jgi:uncharacterized protein (TIGR02246 family)